MSHYEPAPPSDLILPGDSGDQERALSVATLAEQLIALAVDSVDSPRSKRTYRQALEEFLAWHAAEGRPALTRALIQRYKTHLQARGLAPRTINLKLSAVRKLVSEAADNGLVDPVQAHGIRAVKGVKTEGVRMGNWLTARQAQALLDAPDPSTQRGLRDRALLAVLLGAALRREECASLTVDHLQQREGRWVMVDLLGKRGKLRSVPLPAWVKAALDDWTAAAGITGGPLWRAFRKGDHIDLQSTRLTSQAIWTVVTSYAGALGLTVAPHDLRRTSAKLMRAGGASIEQISLILGHSSIDVTKRYLGVELDLEDAATDRIGLTLGQRPQRLAGLA
jgi:site-specific recombinase XerD